MNLNDLKQQKAKLITDARALLEKAEQETRDLTSDESDQWERMLSDADKIQKTIDREERQRELDRDIEAVRTEPERPEPGATAQSDEERTKAEEGEKRSTYGRFLKGEIRALEAGADVAGGFLVAPQAVVGEIIRAVDDNNFMRAWAVCFRLLSTRKAWALRY